MAVGDKNNETINKEKENATESVPKDNQEDELRQKSHPDNGKDNEINEKASEEIEIEIAGTESPETESSTEKKSDDANLKLANEYFDQLQRLQAEFVNYKKRMERERDNLSRYMKADLIRKLLPVIDDFERFLASHQNEIKESGGLNGIQLVYDKLNQILKDEGLEPVSALGQPFDPNFHEALLLQEVSDEQDGKILEVWEKGYFLGESLLRPSKVKVGKKK
ncbi:nucleotide exchange factor GrpE [candidate division KSB1 bacterium]|nr:nucleotide exchange factor GrpE [candidate division KSB1 bacterium]